MDVWGVYYGGETGSFCGSMRSPYYRDYEQFPYGSLEQTNTHVKDPYSKVQEICKQAKAQKLTKKDCPFCKEHKKRPLVNYLRKRQFRNHESICEEDDEECHDNIEHHIQEEDDEEKEAQAIENLEKLKASNTTPISKALIAE